MLTEAGIEFRKITPQIQEDNNLHSDPYQLAQILAVRKSEAVKEMIAIDEIALGCDTIVVLDNEILGKPSSKDEAFSMLAALSGQKHTVCSAIALLTATGESVGGFELTDVYFRSVCSSDIEKYIDSGEPLDKAGAYGIQDRGVFLVDRVVGNIDNVIGLPRTLLDELAGKLAEEKGLYGI